MVLDLITNPDGFFERAAEDDGLAKPAGVVLAVGVVGAVSSYPSLRASTAALPPEASSFAVVIYATSFVGLLLGPFVVWAIYAGAFHGISGLIFDGEGSFRRTLAVTAWGFVPAILAAVVGGVLAYVAFQSITIPSDPAQAMGFARQLRSHPLLRLSGVIGIAFLIWQGFLWTFAVEHARGLDLRDAAITVAIPIGVAVLLRLSGLV